MAIKSVNAIKCIQGQGTITSMSDTAANDILPEKGFR